jgi:hypothetical protein
MARHLEEHESSFPRRRLERMLHLYPYPYETEVDDSAQKKSLLTSPNFASGKDDTL